MSAGVAHNKLLAKLAAGLHKPDQQSILPAAEAAPFMCPLPLRAIPGIGSKAERGLNGLGIMTVGELRGIALSVLLQHVNGKVAAMVLEAAWGCDSRAVSERGPPKAMSVEDSFVQCDTKHAVDRAIQVAPNR